MKERMGVLHNIRSIGARLIEQHPVALKGVFPVTILVLVSGLVQLRAFTFSNGMVAALVTLVVVLLFPGLLLTALLFRQERLFFIRRTAISFVLGTALLIVPATALVVLESFLGYLVWISIGLTVGLGSLYCWTLREQPDRFISGTGKGITARLNPFLVAAFVAAIAITLLIFVLTVYVPAYGDRWNYAAYMRQYLDWPHLVSDVPNLQNPTADFRMKYDGWLVLEAYMSWIAGVDPIDMLVLYLPPLLMVISLFAFYSLARELFKSANAALFLTVVQIIYLTASMTTGGAYEPGHRFFVRIAEDKIAVSLILLPIALMFALRYLRRGRLIELLAYALSIATLAFTHPMGLPFFAISFGSYAPLHLWFNRSRQAVIRLLVVFFLVCIFAAVPFAGKLAAARAGITASAYTEALEEDPSRGEARELLMFSSRWYMVDPKRLLNSDEGRLLIVVLLLTPFLFWHLRRSEAARFLFTTGTIPLLIIYNPITASLLGQLITPWQIRRIEWLVPVSLIIGFFLYKIVETTGGWLKQGLRLSRDALLFRSIPIAILVLFGLVMRSDIEIGLGKALLRKQGDQIQSDTLDIARYICNYLTVDSTVMVDRPLALHLPACSTMANVLPRAKTNPDVLDFYAAELVDPHLLTMLERNNATYVVLEKTHPLVGQLTLLPTLFSEIHRNSTYRFYRFNHDPLESALLHGYSNLVELQWDEAARDYGLVASAVPDNLSALVGLAASYRGKGWTMLELLPLYSKIAALSEGSAQIVDFLASELSVDPSVALGYAVHGPSYQTPRSPNVAYAFLDHLDTAQIIAPDDKGYVRRDTFIIGGSPRGILFQHAPSQVSFELELPSNATLVLATALAPETWQLGKGDGVRFGIDLQDGSGSTYGVLSEYIDPKNVPSHRGWIQQEVDLALWSGQTITLTFITDPGPNGNNLYDWAGWGEPRIVQPITFDFLDHLSDAQIQNTKSAETEVVTQTIDYETRPVLAQPCPSQVIYSLTLPPQSSLRFGVGLAPEVWSAGKGDGVEYNTYVSEPRQPNTLHRLFHRYVDPKNHPEDRHWLDEQVDLGRFGGQQVEIIFEAKPSLAGEATYCGAGWSRPVLIDETLPDDARSEGDDSVGTP